LRRTTSDDAQHWRALGLIEGAPECAIEAAWLWQIARHHPDRGGDAEVARAINVARDELKGTGARPNEYVAQHYDAQPWLVLGVRRDAKPELAQRVGAQLAGALARHRRLADRVAWAVANFAGPVSAPVARPGRARVTPLTPPPPPRRRSATRPAPPKPSVPGRPEGLPDSIDLGTVAWREPAPRTLRLTWRELAPYEIRVEAPAALRTEVVASRALPGRFVITLDIDWDSVAFTHDPGLRGHALDGSVIVRWPAGGEAAVPVRGVVLYPAAVVATPPSVDFGAVPAGARVRASIVLMATAPATAKVETPAWLARVNGDGSPREDALRLPENTAVRVELAVQWAPILERAAAAFAAGRPVRPTGMIGVRWGDRSLEIPAEAVVTPPPAE
jgi:hypothetical protein